MPTVIFVRHGENDYVKKGRLAGRFSGVHLNETGMRQAQALTTKLVSGSIKAIFSSPLERAIETAQPIADHLGLPIFIRPGLVEVDCGDWQGQSLKMLRRLKIWRQVISSPSLFQFPNGETFRNAQLRIVNDVLELTGRYGKDDTLLIVSHSDPIKLAVAYFIGLPLDRFQSLQVSPGSMSTLIINSFGASLLGLNLFP